MEKIRTDSTKVCKHVIIESDNFFVCVKCGVVQNDLLVCNIQEVKKEECFKEPSVNFKLIEKIDFLKELKARDVINDVTFNDSIYYIKKWDSEKIPLNKLHHAYALYYAAKKNHFPLTLKEISYYSQISVKEICKIEKFITNVFEDDPLEYVSKYCGVLGLTFMDEKIVKAYIEENYKFYIRNSSHVAIAAISIIFPCIEKKTLSKISWTAVSTIKKISHDLQAGLFK
jgi:transcription initiation factor TFIIIB Brf1 subunit/transcription initiation factor TFIIB